MPDPKRARFLYGILFAWVPCLPLITSMASGILSARSKAIGLGAIAGGLSEALLTLVPLCTIVAIFLLARSFAHGHRLRAIVATISMLWSLLVLLLLGVSAWAVISHR